MSSFKKLITVTVFGFGISLVLFVLLVKPNLDKVTILYLEASNKQTMDQTLQDQILAYKSSQSEIAAVPNKDFLLSSILERNKLQVVIEELEEGADKAGVGESLSIRDELDAKGKPKPTVPVIQGNSNIDEVYYLATVTGTFIQVVEFIQYTERLPHFTEILKIDLRSAGSDGGETGVKINDDNIIADIQAIFMVRKVK